MIDHLFFLVLALCLLYNNAVFADLHRKLRHAGPALPSLRHPALRRGPGPAVQLQRRNGDDAPSGVARSGGVRQSRLGAVAWNLHRLGIERRPAPPILGAPGIAAETDPADLEAGPAESGVLH